MQNIDKIYPLPVAVPIARPKFFNRPKDLLRRSLPAVLKASAAGFVLLVLQIAAVGVLDRAGLSPKAGFIFSSLIYVCGLLGLLAAGRAAKARPAGAVEAAGLEVIAGEPVCVILIIKREGAIKL